MTARRGDPPPIASADTEPVPVTPEAATVRATPGAMAPDDDAAGTGAASAERTGRVDRAARAGRRYRPRRELARGGMGRVLEATDELLGRTVALKEALATDPDALRRFERETRITARLEHPSIVPVYDAGAGPDGEPFYVMRKVSGRPLEQLVFEAGELESRLALLPHLLAAAQAVAHAHQRGILHRDLKPSNILVGELGETIVIDWGLAKVIGETDELSPGEAMLGAAPPEGELRTRIGAVLGTPGFMSPEQLESSDVDERADVYALGATLYYLLARRPPHAGASADEMMLTARLGPPAPVDSLVRGVPRELSTICDKALAYDAATRYRDAAALAEELRRFLDGQLVAAHRYSAGERLGRFVRKHRALVATVAAALALLAIGAWIAVGRVLDARDDAVAQAGAAEAARAREADRAAELTLSQARLLLDANPAAALALARPFAGTARWREVRAIAAGARAAGVPWRLPSSGSTSSIAMSADGARAVTCGGDGVVRVHELAARTTREVARAAARARAAFVDDHRLAIWHGSTLMIQDVTGAGRTIFERPSKIAVIAARAGTVWGADAERRAWRLDPAHAAITQLAIEDRIRVIAPSPDGGSPDGGIVAFGGDLGLWLVEGRGEPRRIADGKVFQIAWEPGAAPPRLIAMLSQGGLEVALPPGAAPVLTPLDETNDHAALVAGHRHTFGIAGRRVDGRALVASDLAASLLGLHPARGDLVVNAAPAELQVWAAAAHLALPLPLPAGPPSALAASPRSPYVVAAAGELLLLWDLDDVMPRRVPAPRYVQLAPVGPRDAWTISLTGASRWLDLAAGTAAELPRLGPVRTAASPSGATALAIELAEPRAWRLQRGRPGGERLPMPVELAAFLDEARVAYVTPTGELGVYDLGAGRAAPLAALPGPARSLVQRAPWVAVALRDGGLVRVDLTTGAQAEIRIAGLGAIGRPDPDGRIWVASRQLLRAWGPDGAVTDHAELPAPIDSLTILADRRALVGCEDGRAYLVSLAPRAPGSRAAPALEPAFDLGRAFAADPEAGLVAIADRRPGVQLVDLAARTAWRVARALPPESTPALTGDASAVLLRDPSGPGEPEAVLVWPLDLPASPEATARWIERLTNAEYDPALAKLTWR